MKRKLQSRTLTHACLTYFCFSKCNSEMLWDNLIALNSNFCYIYIYIYRIQSKFILSSTSKCLSKNLFYINDLCIKLLTLFFLEKKVHGSMREIIYL